jgi:hypothetical protein
MQRLEDVLACPAPFGEPGADAACEVQATQLGDAQRQRAYAAAARRPQQGWMHGGGDLGDSEALDRFINRLNQLREEEGRTGPFEIQAMSVDAYKPNGIKRLEDRGVTDIVVGFRLPYIIGPDPEPLENKIRAIEKDGEKVISKL